MFEDFFRSRADHRWPPNSHWEFRITRIEPRGALVGQWEITLVYLGVGAKGKGKGDNAHHREIWAYGGENPLQEFVDRMDE